MTRQDILARTIERCRRLIDFCELGAPDYILGAEADLIRRGVFCLGEEAAKPLANRLVEDAKLAAGLCIWDGCLEQGVSELHCELHAAHHLAELKTALSDEPTGCADDHLSSGFVAAARRRCGR